MKSIQEQFAIGKLTKMIKPAGTQICETCGNEYKVYETPVGIQGACKPCSDNEIRKNLPYVEDLKEQRALNFIESFERVPRELKQATVKNYKPQHETQEKAKETIIQFIKGFAENRGESLILSGTPGLGKSHLAYATAKALKGMKYKVLYVKVSDLLEHVRSTYGRDAKVSESMIFEMIQGLDLLVLDDIGAEYVKLNESGSETWVSDVLCKVFDLRLNQSVICTTNYSEFELANKYGKHGDRITSRMLENATGIRLEGKDQRKKREAF